MTVDINREFGDKITQLIQKKDLSRTETKNAFSLILENRTTEMQQGAFLAALTAKGETAEEVAGSWEAIYELDTVKVSPSTSLPIVENSGTGMDSFKTFNISTAASLIAATNGVAMARHGARAITSKCGTVDMAEALGVNVECEADMVTRSIEKSGVGLFNGMSPHVHPMALGRILSNLFFGTTLNTAASLANPALPKIGVRGVYSKDRIRPVIDVMKAIGYRRAMVFHGSVADSSLGMDEVSVCGPTYGAELTEDGQIKDFTITPSDFGLPTRLPDELSPAGDLTKDASDFVSLMKGQVSGSRAEVVALNAGLILYISGKANSMADGVARSVHTLAEGNGYQTLENWVASQNNHPDDGLSQLRQYN